MIKLLLNLLDKIPYKTKFRLSLSDLLKLWYYEHINVKKCFCGGNIICENKLAKDDCSWEIKCEKCNFLFDED